MFELFAFDSEMNQRVRLSSDYMSSLLISGESREDLWGECWVITDNKRKLWMHSLRFHDDKRALARAMEIIENSGR